jgi:NDP-sugar pyrophosphorylase family protein
MPTLFNTFIEKEKKVISFPIHEYWLDIGRLEEYKKANEEYENIF